MTPERRRAFEAEWPRLAARLEPYLRARGIQDGQCDDVLQETALRLFGMWERVVLDGPLWPLARTIALNVLRDRGRRPEPEPTDVLPETATGSDAADAGLARVELQRVRAALHELTPAQREALLAEIGVTSARPRNAAGKMLRLRARQKLTRLLERVPVVAPLRSGRLSELGQWLVPLREAAVQGASCLVCVALGLGAVVGPGLLAPPAPGSEVAPADEQVAPPLVLPRGVVDVASHRSDIESGSATDPSGAPASRARSGGTASKERDDRVTPPPVPLVPEEVPLPRTHGPGDGEVVSPPESLPAPDEREAPLPVPGDLDLEDLAIDTAEVARL